MTSERHQRLSRVARKERLLFGRKREQRHHKFVAKLQSILSGDQVTHLDSATAEAILFKANYEGVGSAVHINHGKTRRVELGMDDCQKLVAGPLFYETDELVFVFPTEWQLCGGFLVSLSELLRRFSLLSFAMEDDFDVYVPSLDSSLTVRGDRTGVDLAACVLVSRGSGFDGVLDLVDQVVSG